MQECTEHLFLTTCTYLVELANVTSAVPKERAGHGISLRVRPKRTSYWMLKQHINGLESSVCAHM
jgi:hypothetical protein